MKKLFAAALLSSMLISSVFSITLLERATLPKFTGDLNKVSYKIIDSTEDKWVIEIDGVTYIYDLKK